MMDMKNSVQEWAMSLKPQCIEAIRKGVKRYEVRTRVPVKMRVGDRIFVVQTASDGKVAFRVIVRGIYLLSPRGAWSSLGYAFGIPKEEYDKYTRGRRGILLIGICKVEEVPEGMTVRDLGLKKAPQWFSRIKGKFSLV